MGEAKEWHGFDQILLIKAATWVSETKFSAKIELDH